MSMGAINEKKSLNTFVVYFSEEKKIPNRSLCIDFLFPSFNWVLPHDNIQLFAIKSHIYQR